MNGELVLTSILRMVMLSTDLERAYLLAGGPEWIMICGGTDTVSPLTQNPNGLKEEG